MLDGLRAEGARLSDGAPLPSGGRLRVASAARAVPTTLRESQIADHLILMVALDVRDYNKGEPTIFVTKDVNLRIRADSLGLTSMDFEGEQIDIDELYSGMTELVDQRRRRRHVLRPEHAAAAGRHLQGQPVRPAARSRQPVAQRARPLRRRRQAAGAAAQAAGGHLGDPPAQQGAALRAGSAALRRHQAGHARRQGRHRQDDAGARRRACRRSSRSRSIPSCWCRARSSRSAATSGTCPATSRRS